MAAPMKINGPDLQLLRQLARDNLVLHLESVSILKLDLDLPVTQMENENDS